MISVLSIRSIYWDSVFEFNINNGSRARLNGSWEFIENAEAVNGEVKWSLLRGCCDQEKINMMDWT